MNIFTLSKPLTHGAKRPTIVVLVLCLLIVEALIRTPAFWTLNPETTTGRRDLRISAALEQAPRPKVVFLGSSRIQHAVSPLVLAETLKIDSDEVLNIFVAGGSPIAYLEIYRRHRPSLSGADLLVVNVGARDFNWGRPTTISSNFRNFASLRQRLQVPVWRDKIDVLAGWFWRTWDGRFVQREYVYSVLTGKFGFVGIGADKVEVDELLRIAPRTGWDVVPSHFQPRNYPKDVEFHKFKFSDLHLQALIGLMELAEQDGLELLILETPLTPPTSEEIAFNFSELDFLWRENILDATRHPVTNIPFETEECVRWEDCYFDYGHMTAIGATAYSKELGFWLSKEYPAIFSPTGDTQN